MGRIFLSAGHGGFENGLRDPGAIAGGTTEAREMIQLRDLVIAELRSRSLDVLAVPDDLSEQQTITWINSRAQSGDIALELHANAFYNPSLRGASIFYIANNSERKNHAELLLLALLRRVPQLPTRGAKADTISSLGRLPFIRNIYIPSLMMEVGLITNPEDRALMQNRRRDMALGIADGLSAWSRTLNPTPSPKPTPAPTKYPTIGININGQVYEEQGIIINGNSYIPIDLVDRLGVDLSQDPDVRRINYGNVVYLKAIELRDHNISVGWESASRTVVVRSILKLCPGDLDRIMSQGKSSEVQLMIFLKANNERGLQEFPDLPRLYREEGTIEGVNYDIAFAQMCLETTFLRFGGEVQSNQNNFAGLGNVAGTESGASFPSARIGVRAQIQQLKAYASTEPLVQELVAPRFRFVTRGIAPLVPQLSGRWSADPQYGQRILALLRQLYESSGLI
ncbi:hormogonium tapered terminus morphoprotein TftA [Roseofilum casamattae]|uniref:N-acetylmuramoyl-L-alanine amidase n=1 Tax=Roseofilum casamattae BLCC-M143 TaxID=3022442 RepID=A0ABT7BW13_9CYAN|nr:N-acetylmuramoyl-L-alanine amidase [Roseofilum casamattae]MDJ1182646.1 N-acetylmuramoyl-L-alanine amidase [Roseofilum casamattae BLCC-M143]